MVTRAVRTEKAINDALQRDGGALFRRLEGQVLPHIGDAYDGDTFPFRSHMGASLIGGDCPRKIWYSWRWALIEKHEGRLLRLFNRGHLEEGRFIALLLMIGVQVYQQDASGKQYRISDCNGHFGGSGDGVGIGVPDLADGTPCLLEFKTHNDKSFKNLVANGVFEAKFEHYVQMNVYMYKMGLPVALYGAVNKNDDDVYFELVTLNTDIALQFINRADNIINCVNIPSKLNNSPGYYKCKWCSYNKICHLNAPIQKTCRTCEFVVTKPDGVWYCKKQKLELSKQQQFGACNQYQRLVTL